MRARATALAALSAACAPIDTRAIPGLPDGAEAKTIVLLDAPSVDDPRVITGVVRVGPTFLDEADRWPYALLYALPPEALGLAPGPLAHEPGATGRLRRPEAARARPEEAWEDAPDFAERPALKLLRFRPASDDPCSSGRGCLEERSTEEALYCAPDCEPFEVDPPAPPAPISRPCATGFARTATVEGVHVCRASPPVCEDTRRARLGGSCGLVGPACPEGDDYASPTRAAVYAHADATGGGDGTRARPWTLAEALEQAAPGALVLLSAGAHAAPVARVEDLELVGACARLTHIDSEELRVAGTSTIAALDWSVSSYFEVEPGARADASGARLELNGGLIEGALALNDAIVAARAIVVVRGALSALGLELRGGGLHAEGGRMALEGLVARTPLLALRAFAGGGLTLDRSYVEGQGVDTPLVLQTASATVSDLELRGGLPMILLDGGASLRLSGATLDPREGAPLPMGLSWPSGIAVANGSRLAMEDSVSSRGIFAVLGASVRLDRVAALGFSGYAAFVENSTLEGRDLVLVGGPHPGGLSWVNYAGIRLEADANVALERVKMLRPGPLGLYTESAGTISGARLSVFDSEISGSLVAALWMEGSTSLAGSTVDVRRAYWHELEGTGLVYELGRLRLSALHLRIAGVTPSGALGATVCERQELLGSCAGRGVVVARTVVEVPELKLKRFVVEGYTRTAFDVLGRPALDAVRGRIGPGDFGISASELRGTDAFSQVENQATVPWSDP